jgi:hypothetical protein
MLDDNRQANTNTPHSIQSEMQKEKDKNGQVQVQVASDNSKHTPHCKANRSQRKGRQKKNPGRGGRELVNQFEIKINTLQV